MRRQLLDQTFRVLRECGRARDECVIYWSSPLDAGQPADRYDHPLHLASIGGYEVDPAWLTQYWFKLADERRTLRAQIHTHPGAAFHSKTDDDWPIVSQSGFISIVIPRFAQGAVSLEEAWIGRLNDRGRWERVGPHSSVEFVP